MSSVLYEAKYIWAAAAFLGVVTIFSFYKTYPPFTTNDLARQGSYILTSLVVGAATIIIYRSGQLRLLRWAAPAALARFFLRSEARRVGQACVSQCRVRWRPYH